MDDKMNETTAVSKPAAPEPDETKAIETQDEPAEVRGAKIARMSTLDLVGVKTRVSSKQQTNFADIEAFIKQKEQDGTLDALKALAVPDEQGEIKLYGVTLNFDRTEYDYFLGVESKETPKEASGLEDISLAESLYAVFTASGAAPESIKACWRNIYNDWFGSVPYNHSGAAELEEWTLGQERSAEDFQMNIYVPVKRIIKKAGDKRPSIFGYVVGGGLGVLTGAVLGGAMGDTRTGILIGLVAGLVLGRLAQKILEDRFKK